MFLKKLILIRSGEAMHGDKKDSTVSPSLDELKTKRSPLSHMGKLQMEESKIQIWPYIKTMPDVDIYSSDSRSAVESSEKLFNLFYTSAKPIRSLKIREEIYSDPAREYDLKWIKEELETSTAHAIIMVGSLDLVWWLPKDLDFHKIKAKAGEGACLEMETKVIEEITFEENWWRKEAFK